MDRGRTPSFLRQAYGEQAERAVLGLPILGSGNKPGHVELPEANQPKMTIVELLARAGGPNWLADLRHVRVRQANAASGTVVSTVINVDDVLSAKAPMDAKLIELQPGDIVTVPERML